MGMDGRRSKGGIRLWPQLEHLRQPWETVQYQIRSALHEEAKEGWVWIFPPQRPSTIHIQIRNSATGRTVVCEQREIDANFRWLYNARQLTRSLPPDENVIVISSYYRDRLGVAVDTDDPQDLNITATRGPLAGLSAGLKHPASVVRTATWLGILSVLLGVLSFGLAIAVLGH
jgi:hypothetical protein